MLTKEELQKIIDQFDEATLKQQAVFAISQHVEDLDQGFIRANKEGLELFALELLKSARYSEDVLSDPERSIIPFDCNENWIDENSDVFIHYVEPIADKQKLQPREKYKPTLTDELMPYGCGLILILLVISTIVGLLTITKWLL